MSPRLAHHNLGAQADCSPLDRLVTPHLPCEKCRERGVVAFRGSMFCGPCFWMASLAVAGIPVEPAPALPQQERSNPFRQFVTFLSAARRRS